MTASGRSPSASDVIAEFGDALRAAGLRLTGEPVMDGAWHRAAVDGDKGAKRSGRYRGYLNGIRPAGFIENFKNPSVTGTWKAGAEAPRMSKADRAAVDALQAARARDAEARLDAIAQESAAAWERAAPAPADHPYVAAKRILPDGLRVDGHGRLLLPMHDFDGRLRAVQTIAPDGRKLFPAGAKVHGLHLLLGEVEPDGVLLIAEGYATAATLRRATGFAVAAGYTKANFVGIARQYGRAFRNLRIVFCGDNDHRLPRRDPPLPNVGKEAAEDAARATGGTAIVPAFEPHEPGSDWNDYAALHGLDAVRAAIQAALPPPPSPPLQPHYPAPTNSRDEAMAALEREVASFFADAATHVSAAEAWRKGVAALDMDLPPKSPGRRAALRAARAEMAALYGPDWRKPGRRLLMPAAAGGGKTKLTEAEIAARLPGLGRVNFYTDSLDNAEAVASKIPTAKVVRGRSAMDPKSPNGARMCLRHEAAEAVAFAGLPVSETMCRSADGRKTCPLFGRCGYQRDAAERRDGATVSVGSHEYLTLRGGMPSPDAVVIDENCVSKLIGHVEFGADRLLPIETPNWQAGGLAAATIHRGVMQRVAEALPDPAGILAGLRSRGIRSADDLKPAVAFLRAVEDQEFTAGIVPTMDDAAVLERLERHARSEIHPVLKMLTALQEEIGLPRDHANGVAYHADKPVTVDGHQERQNRISVHYRKPLAFGADVPLLVLDASGDAEIYRRLLGDRLNAATAVQCERHAEVVQVVDATLPRSSLLGTDRRGNALSDTGPARADRLRGEMVATANALAAKHGGAFMLATNMAVETAVTAELADVGVTSAVVTGHFGKMRGRNDFEHCAAGMVLGRNQPPASAMEAMARAIWSDDPEPLNLPGTYGTTTRGIRMRDGSAVPVEVATHPDPRVQRVLELHRERESEQAADRLRLIHNSDRKVLYVACNLPLNLTVDRVVTRQALIHEATGRMDNGRPGKGRRLYGNRLAEAYRLGGGVLPLSHRELCRVFSDLWPSKRAVENDFGKCPVSAIQTLLAETGHLNPSLVRYRLEGQRCPSRALVSPELPDGRAALALLLGKPVVAYEVENPSDPPGAPQPSPPADPASEPAPPDEPGGERSGPEWPPGGPQTNPSARKENPSTPEPEQRRENPREKGAFSASPAPLFRPSKGAQPARSSADPAHSPPWCAAIAPEQRRTGQEEALAAAQDAPRKPAETARPALDPAGPVPPGGALAGHGWRGWKGLSSAPQGPGAG